MINVTRTYLPPIEEYMQLVQECWNRSWITNNGQLLLRLEKELRQKLQSEFLWVTSNGTIVLQMALQAVNARGGEVITTPFSYVATSNAIAWEGCKPVFCDINPETLCIDASKIEALITPETKAILATHVFGIPCDIKAISAIAQKYHLPVIYDGAHAFGVMYKGKPLLAAGDMSTCSFHATKLFHTIEGGCIICHDAALSRKLELFKHFGHAADNYYQVGINGKNSEIHAAMGLVMLPRIDSLIAERKQIFDRYAGLFHTSNIRLLQPEAQEGLQWNYCYFPVIFESEAALLAVKAALEKSKIFPRRYFYPALNTLPFYGDRQTCPQCESIASRVLCLPFYNGLEPEIVRQVAEIVNENC